MPTISLSCGEMGLPVRTTELRFWYVVKRRSPEEICRAILSEYVLCHRNQIKPFFSRPLAMYLECLLCLTGQRELAETTGSLWIASRAGCNLEHRLRHRDLVFESSRWERLLILSAEARATLDDAPLIF